MKFIFIHYIMRGKFKAEKKSQKFHQCKKLSFDSFHSFITTEKQFSNELSFKNLLSLQYCKLLKTKEKHIDRNQELLTDVYAHQVKQNVNILIMQKICQKKIH